MIKLAISDSISEVNLISSHSHLVEYRPAVAMRSSEVANTPNADYARINQSRIGTLSESITLAIRGVSRRELGDRISLISQMASKATSYFVSEWSTSPVYLICQTACEPTPRYAVIKSLSVNGLPDLYREPWASSSSPVATDIFLEVERTAWMDAAPTGATPLAISNKTNYYGSTVADFGISAVTGVSDNSSLYDGGLPIANGFSRYNITHIKHYDLGTTTYTDLIPMTSFPVDLFPSPAVGDILFLGCASDGLYGGVSPIFSIVFDLVYPGAADLTLGYYLSDAGAWADPAVDWITPLGQRMTAGYDANLAVTDQYEGKGVFTYYPTSSHAKATVDGVEAYWIAIQITAVGGSPTSPQQQNQAIYACRTPYVEIASSVVDGAFPALLELRVKNVSDQSLDSDARLISHGIIAGVRGNDRGEDFSAVHPAVGWSGEDPGATVSWNAYVEINLFEMTAEDDPESFSGERGTCTSLTLDSWVDILFLRIDPAAFAQYTGKYRVFLRYTISGRSASAYDDFKFRMRYNYGDTGIETINKAWVPYNSYNAVGEDNEFELGDLGYLELPGPLANPLDAPLSATITVDYWQPNATPTLHVYDVILMPTDEWGGTISIAPKDPSDGVAIPDIVAMYDETQLVASSTSTFRRSCESRIRYFYSGADKQVLGGGNNDISGPITVRPGVTSKVWILNVALPKVKWGGEPVPWRCPPSITSMVQVSAQNMYAGPKEGS